MEDALNSVPPEAWPLIAALFNVTIVVTMLWALWSGFIFFRRSASNLTPVSSARSRRDAQPDFLQVDEKARKRALERGARFDEALARRDLREEREARRALRRKETVVARIGRLVSFAMALFSLATMISGTVFQVSIMGRYWEQYSAGERLMAVLQEHPIGVTVTVAVILFNIITFVSNRKWEGA